MKSNVLEQIREEYSLMVMDIQTVAKDPFEQFAMWFGEAVKADITEPNAMFLCTSGVDGKPSGRMVLLKEFNKKGFVFYTNYESRKGKEISVNPFVAITFHWKELERQIRILGKAGKVSSAMSDAYFESRPPGSRLSAVVSPQSEVINGRKVLEDRIEKLLTETGDKKIKRPENWGGYIVKPYLFEFWQGRESRLHDRIQYRLEKKKWIIERLAP